MVVQSTQMKDPKENYKLYIENAHEMIEVAKSNLGNDFYSSACNRAYYAIFMRRAPCYTQKENLMASIALRLPPFVGTLSKQVSLTKNGVMFTSTLCPAGILAIMNYPVVSLSIRDGYPPYIACNSMLPLQPAYLADFFIDWRNFLDFNKKITETIARYTMSYQFCVIGSGFAPLSIKSNEGQHQLSDHLEKEQVVDVVKQAQLFVEEVEKWLLEQDIL